MLHSEIGARALRAELSRILDEVRQGERVMIRRNGRAVAALVPPHELTALEKADHSRMVYHEQMAAAKLRDLKWLRAGLDAARTESQD